MRIGSTVSDRAAIFREEAGKRFFEPRVLEIGTLRWDEQFPTHHRSWFPLPVKSYTMTDISAGTDVDIVSDAHDLTRTFGFAAFEVVIAVSVWEHLRRPWVAMKSVFDVLRPGGMAYICTHQTFPIHGYPDDYFRFSDQAMRSMAEDAWLEVEEVGYTYPCSIEPGVEIERWNRAAEAYLNVDIIVSRPE